MFQLNGTNLTLTQGDTGVLTILTNGYTLTENDCALFTVRRRNSGVLCEMVLTAQEDGAVQIPFTNDLTDDWKADEYEWDIRFVLDVQMANGKPVDGREVITPMRPGKLTIVKAVGRV